MFELIPHPGLQSYVLHLAGKLEYSLTIADKPPKYFELSDADFEDIGPPVKEHALHPDGVETSEVGLAIRIVKNVGVLDISFEGRNGERAEWSFVGLKEKGSLRATAGVQTESAQTRDHSMQTTVKRVVNAGIQTKKKLFRRHDRHAQTMLGSNDMDELLEISRLHTEEDEYDPAYECSSSDYEDSEYQDSDEEESEDEWCDPWPRHLYSCGRRTDRAPKMQKFGRIHIDRKTAKLQWRQRYGEEEEYISLSAWSRMWRTISFPGFRADLLYTVEVLHDRDSKSLEIGYRHPNSPRASLRTRLTMTYGNDSGRTMYAKDNDRGYNKSEFDDMEVIVEEIKICIDRTTGRRCSVPEPKTETPFIDHFLDFSERKRRGSQDMSEVQIRPKRRRP